MKRSIVALLAALLAALLSVSPAPKTTTARAAAETRALPVLMYHSLLRSRKSDYIVSPETLEADIDYLARQGYESVTALDLARFADGSGDLPEKPILLTFDDGHYNNLYYGLDVLKAHGWHAVVNVIGKFSEYSDSSGDGANPNYSHLTWSEIREIAEDGTFEIGNHTYAMHDYSPRFGAGRMDGENDEEYAAALRADVGRLQDILREKCGVTPIAFAYPFGRRNELAETILRELGFRMTFTSEEGVNIVEKGNPDSLFKLRRYNRFPSYCPYDLAAKFRRDEDKARAAYEKRRARPETR